MARKPVEYVNESTHPRLLHGAEYTIPQLSIITGIKTATLWGRIVRSNKGTVDNDTFRDIDQMRKRKQSRTNAYVFERLESESERLSDKWIRMAL